MIEEYFKQFIQLCGCSDTMGGCMISQRIIQPGYISPFLRIDVYIMLFCTSGEIEITLNMHTFHVYQNSLFIYSPNDVIHVECSKSCSLIFVALTSDYFYKNHNYWKHILFLIQMKRKPLIPLSAEELEDYIKIIDCMRCVLERTKKYEWYREATLCSIRTLLHTVFCQIKIFTACDNKVQKLTYQSRNEEYFVRFIRLVSLNYKQERKVSFYASELCITTKYLSTIVKAISHKTPGRWIDEIVMTEALYLLKYSNISIKEITYQLNFPNVSFFGKFFKRHMGVSPHYYRINDNTLNLI